MQDPNTCPHPAADRHIDRARGSVTCQACGSVIDTNTYEVEVQFQPSTAGPGQMLSSMRHNQPGFARAPRPRAAAHGTHGIRSISYEHARRQMEGLARSMKLPAPFVDTAMLIYRQAVAANAVVGARKSVICACLYLVCRKQRQPQTVIDFSDEAEEPPWAILNHVRIICRATHVEVPASDPSVYVAKMVDALSVPEDQAKDVVLYALKVLRAMREDWLATGRRPLGICAAAVLIACQVHGIERKPADFERLSRLTWSTVLFHAEEFAASPAALLEDIDDYQPTKETVPPAYRGARGKDKVKELEDKQRGAQTDFYVLVEAAREQAPITADRVELWKRFMIERAKAHGVQADERLLDVRTLSPEEQLVQLGVPNKAVRGSRSVSRANSMQSNGGGHGHNSMDVSMSQERHNGDDADDDHHVDNSIHTGQREGSHQITDDAKKIPPISIDSQIETVRRLAPEMEVALADCPLFFAPPKQRPTVAAASANMHATQGSVHGGTMSIGGHRSIHEKDQFSNFGGGAESIGRGHSPSAISDQNSNTIASVHGTATFIHNTQTGGGGGGGGGGIAQGTFVDDAHGSRLFGTHMQPVMTMMTAERRGREIMLEISDDDEADNQLLESLMIMDNEQRIKQEKHLKTMLQKKLDNLDLAYKNSVELLEQKKAALAAGQDAMSMMGGGRGAGGGGVAGNGMHTRNLMYGGGYQDDDDADRPTQVHPHLQHHTQPVARRVTHLTQDQLAQLPTSAIVHRELRGRGGGRNIDPKALERLLPSDAAIREHMLHDLDGGGFDLSM